MNVLGEASYQTNLKDRSRELMELTIRLNQEYAQLIETSLVLRKESRILSEDSDHLRRAGIKLLWD